MQSFWNEPSAEELLGGGGWLAAATDADDYSTEQQRREGAVAAVYVPHIPGFDRVFTYVSDSDADNVDVLSDIVSRWHSSFFHTHACCC